MGEKWMIWASAEGSTKTAEYILKKFIGGQGGPVGAAFVVLVTGVLQTIGGFCGARLRGTELLASRDQIFGSVIFGIMASLASALGVLAFIYDGADIAVISLLVTLSIIPGAFFDWIFFRHPLTLIQCFGIIVFLFAGWSALNFPSISAFASWPVWMWFGVGIAFIVAINEAIAQAVRKADPFVNNFWVGFTTIVVSSAFLFLYDGWVLASRFPGKFWFASLVIGVVIFGMISFKIMSYKGGGTIALKKMIMQGTRLISATLLGALIYGESLTFGKILAIVLFFLAFLLTDKGAWEYFSSRVLNKSAVTL